LASSVALGVVLIVEGNVEEGLGTLAAESQPQAAENDKFADMEMDRGLNFCGLNGGVVELDAGGAVVAAAA
jgi:hypothetical protein